MSDSETVDRDRLLIDVTISEWVRMDNKKEIVPLEDFHRRVKSRLDKVLSGEQIPPLFTPETYRLVGYVK